MILSVKAWAQAPCREASEWSGQKRVDEQWMDFSPDELREFLAADLVEVDADSAFRESLRQKLWRFVRSRYGRGGGEDA